MPNWINNTVLADGTPASLDKLEKIIRNVENGSARLFEQVDPCPKELAEEKCDGLAMAIEEDRPDLVEVLESILWKPDDDHEIAETARRALAIARNKKKYGHASWYGWNCDHWGVKWDADNDSVSLDGRCGNSLSFSFSSPWDTPAKGLQTLADATGCSLNVEWYDADDCEEDDEGNPVTLSYSITPRRRAKGR